MNMDKKEINKRFTVYDSKAETVLELMREFGDLAEDVCNELNTKTDLHGDHKGSWQGLNRPTMSEEGMRSTVEDIIDNKIPSINETLGTIQSEFENKFNYLYSNDLRKFKPIFAFNCIGSACCDSKTYEQQTTLINQMKEIGVEETSLCIYINEKSDGTMINTDDTSMIDSTVQYCKDNNIKISKIHLYVNQEFDTVTSNFNTNYKAIVRSVLEKYKGLDYEYFVVWNEATSRVRGNVVKETLLECMDIVKSYNKKVGIALMGVSPLFYVPSELIEKSDFIGFNYYQSIGDKKEQTTLADSVYAWENKGLLDMINTACRRYPDKEILLTESGIIGSYDCLMSPAGLSRSWFTYDFNGHVCELYYGGMLEVLKNSNIKKIYGWFPHDFVKYPNKMRTLLNKYIPRGEQ